MRLRGAAVFAAYGTVEALFATVIGHSLPPDVRFALFLLIAYPLIGALLGRFAVVGLAVAFAANAGAVLGGASLAVPLLSAAMAIALYRTKPWIASLLLFAPLCVLRELAFASTFRTKALLTAAAIVVVMLLGWLTAKLRWPARPVATAPRDVALDQPPPAAAANILLIVMDTVRADHLPIYGYARNTTPHLAQFAKTATLYSRVYATSNMTLPSHASLFTGLYASEHTAHLDEGWHDRCPLEH